MYEFTMGGAWFRWSALDRRSKQWAAVSLVAAMLAVVPWLRVAGSFGYRAGYRLGRHMAGGADRAAPAIDASAPAWAAWITLGCALVSAIAWWRFSRRQDEMFNRIQNWTLGMAGAWGIGLLFCWAMVAAALGAPMPNPLTGGLAVLLMLYGFWFAAVRRWA